MFSVDNLGSALRFLRVRRKRKQVEVAARANVTKAMLSSYEIGHRLPSFKNLTAILNALFEDFHHLQEALGDGPSARYRPPAIRDPIKPECLGKALILLRTHRRLTQEAVANQAKVTKAMLSSYETGRRSPTLRSLAAVLGALKCDFHRLQEALLAVTREEERHCEGGQSLEARQLPPEIEAVLEFSGVLHFESEDCGAALIAQLDDGQDPGIDGPSVLIRLHGWDPAGEHPVLRPLEGRRAIVRIKVSGPE